jgi:outer membrane receptor protein involved in Fe transport
MNSRLMGLLVLLLIFSLVPAMTFAGVTGKIIGKVTDKETGEALPGANVIIEGTSLGAAADVQGSYIILNVPPGTYSLSTSFIGYREVIISNVKVYVDLTTEVNFDLPTEAIEVESISITAERPLINKGATNETHLMTAEDIQNIPIRSYAGIVATASGVVSARGTMYVRGGRRDEVAYYVDGVYSNDLRTGTRVGDVPITSIEQINYQAGGFSAEYGFANSGVVLASSKSGQNRYNLTGEVITDEFLSETEKNLGTLSYGYNVYSLTAGGPVLSDKLRFFLSGEKTYRRDSTPSSSTHPVIDGDYTLGDLLLKADSLRSLGISTEEWIVPVKNVEGILPNNSLNRWNMNGNLLLDLNPVRIKLGGNATFDNSRLYRLDFALANQAHMRKDEDYNYNVYGKVTHTLGSRTFYEATGYYSDFKYEFGDPIFWRNIIDYGDKTDVNNNGVYTSELPQDGLVTYSALRLGTGVFEPYHTYYFYDLNKANVLGAKFDLTHQQQNHEIKAGFEYRYNTLRRYALTRPYQLAGIFKNDPNTDPRLAYRAGYTENFGYPVYFPDDIVDPNSYSDSGIDGAKHPILAAFYLQDKIELSDLILNLGLRWDYVDANDKKLVDPYNVKITGGTMDPSTLTDTKAQSSVSPRFGLSFPVTDKTVFHAQWGKFTQQPELQYLYTGWDYMAGMLSQGNMVTVGNPDLRPVKTTAYEIGIGQQIGLNSSFSITAYYKEIRDLIVLKNRVNALPITYAQYQNGDYGTIKGLSFTYTLRRTNRVSANLNYTLQYASGTGSTSDTDFYITWIGQEYYPTFVAPLDYDQRHTGSLNLDYRTNADDGPEFMGGHPLGNLGLNVLATIGSGFPYTPKRIGDTIFSARFMTAYPVAATNSAYTDWTYDIDLRLDKTIKIGTQNVNVYLWVLNLLGSKLPFSRKNTQQEFTTGIYEATGRPDDNGWLSTTEGQAWIESNGGSRAAALYHAAENNPLNWESPRQIRLGMRFNINP